uniref:MucB/RseB C-terminal domain-containing protein n=1 Tax=Cellvibrio fontiphilus TaxID=1815559 RepID=UPI002B4BD743|nr:MucB/RseB C-terminal domain-containing protein [Cellvibrio fontiphilus]
MLIPASMHKSLQFGTASAIVLLLLSSCAVAQSDGALSSAPTSVQSAVAAPTAAEIQSPEVASLLRKMATIPPTLNYQGSFTYQHKDNPALQSFRIIHWVEDGVEHERLQYLNGPEREVIRTGKALGCESLGDQLLQGKISQLGVNLTRLDQLYRFEIRGPERVAGREATALLALPLDPFRHSSLLTIDNETGLVLKSWLVDESARPLERYQFIDLDLSPEIANLREPKARLHRAATPQLADCNPSANKQPERWSLQWIPPGFAFVGQRQVKNQIDMLMYTDGLTTFSVFIEEATGAVPEGVAQRGATLAVMDSLTSGNKNYRITVVGEIPVVTAQKIAQNISGI